MQRNGDEIHLDGDEARGGSTPHVVRYVLAISLTLAVLALSAIWIGKAMTNGGTQSDPVTAGDHAPSG